MDSAKTRVDEGRVRKPSHERDQSRVDVPGREASGPAPFPGRSISQLPSGPGTRALRQAAVLQMQRTHGNSMVMRQLAPDVQRQDETETTSEVPGPTSDVAGPTGEGNGPSEISGGGSSVSATPGGVDVNGPMVNIHAAMINADGIVRASTIIADNIVASSYTPGAGNLM
jgi:hypothetical protein